MAAHNELGEKGEKFAVEYLLKNDYKIIEKNYRYLKAEVDIIAQKGHTLVGVEVKEVQIIMEIHKNLSLPKK